MIEAAQAFDASMMYRMPGHAVRPLRTEDEAFLFRLFCIVQTEHFTRLGSIAHPALSEPILKLQFTSQRRSYAAAYPSAMHRIVEYRGEPLGQIMIDWSPTDCTAGVDISVHPDARKGGIGLAMLRSWLVVSDSLGKPARLHVMPDNPVRSVYRRLGFRDIDASAVPVHMARSVRG